MDKGSAFAMRSAGARVMRADCDPTCALQACMDSFQVAALKSVVREVDIFVTTAGHVKIIGLEHMQKMKTMPLSVLLASSTTRVSWLSN